MWFSTFGQLEIPLWHPSNFSKKDFRLIEKWRVLLPANGHKRRCSAVFLHYYRQTGCSLGQLNLTDLPHFAKNLAVWEEKCCRLKFNASGRKCRVLRNVMVIGISMHQFRWRSCQSCGCRWRWTSFLHTTTAIERRRRDRDWARYLQP